MTIHTIDAAAARALMEQGALLVDIREPAEHAREHVPGAASAPLSGFAAADIATRAEGRPVIFHCQSGNRTRQNSGTLAGCGVPEIYLLEGGIGGWKAAGMPTRVDTSKPVEMQRQVQIAAGTLVLLGLILAATASVWFAALSAFVGAGLVFAGISGWCGMARVLAVMPWNKAPV